ncbi:type IV secretion system protein TraC [Vibrio vulnificus]|uniref:type IV secretion system protein TraC n=1 Tax=Vibrio vulnificus TaxID=672 RepID=UPI001023BE0C|nr:type IV secretion system protein TraC [Vibrio vulnificus]RZQ33246.1 type IV secretion system protein TraC [Vibrio vulnificus]
MSALENAKRLISRVSDVFDLSFDGYDSSMKQYSSATIPTFDGGSIRSLLPFRTYDSLSKVFIQERSYGFALEAAPLVGATDAIVKQLSQTLATLPEGAWVTILDYASNRVGEHLDAWCSPRLQHGGLTAKMAFHRAKHLSKAIHSSLYEEVPLRLYDYRVIISVCLEGKPSDDNLDSMMSIRDSMMTSLKQANIDSRVMEREQLLSFTQEILGNTEEAKRPHIDINPHDPLNLQAVEDGQKITVKRSRLIFNEGTDSALDVRTFATKKIKRVWPQWENQKLIGDQFNDAQRLPCPTLFTTCFQIVKQDAAQSKIATKALTATKKAEDRGVIASLTPHTRQQAQELQFVMQKLNDGEKLVRFYQQVTLFAPYGQGNRCEEMLKSIYTQVGWKINKVPFLQVQSFLVSIPFTLPEGLGADMEKLDRFKKQLSWSMANLAQLQGEWKGDDWRQPLMLLIGRRGQPLNFNPFLNKDGNYNVAVVGKSGSGKSVFMNDLSFSVLSVGGRDYTIDIGGSYKYPCELFGGQYIDVDENLSLNPFSGLGPREEASASEVAEYWGEVKSMISSIVMSMCFQRKDPTDEEESIILEIVSSVIDQHKQNASFTLIHQSLVQLLNVAVQQNIPETNRATLFSLANMIKPYTEDGTFGKYFKGECNVNFKSNYVVLETEKFESQGPRMMQVVIKLLMYHITEALYHGDRITPTLIKIDEGWKMLESRDSKFIEDAARRVRKYMGSLVTGTQGVGDYFKNPAAEACWLQSDFVVMLSQKAESIAKYKEKMDGQMDSSLERLLSSVRRNEEYYAEALVRTPVGVSAVGRLVLDPYSIAAFSTKGPDYRRVKSLRDALGGDIEKALDIRYDERVLIAEGVEQQEAQRRAIYKHVNENDVERVIREADQLASKIEQEEKVREEKRKKREQELAEAL